jgi:lipopolysaccharide/colanic/teichoic acid biosynthesis glycosyltransferase
MIIRRRQKTASWMRRIFGSALYQLPAPNQLLDNEQFQNELTIEIYRSDRRTSGREFGLIQMVLPDDTPNDFVPDSKLVTALQKRLRITDSIGCYDYNLAFLLPETDKNGTLLVANALAKIALQEGLNVDTEVSIYPWDDELIGLSEQLKTRRDPSDDDSDFHVDSTNGALESGDSKAGNANQASDNNATEQHSRNVQSFAGSGGSRVSNHAMHFVKVIPTPWSKRLLDIVGSVTGLMLLSPVFLLAAVSIKATSRGPVFFVQKREGKNGKPFGILKFRTMIAGAEEKQVDLRGRNQQDGPAFKLENDPRVTRVGTYLRKTCVDELPQLLNVLVGQMSLVGPRPLPVYESYACHAWQRARLTVLPGLTCTWQVRGGRDVKFEQWMRMDLEYIRNRSFLFDLRLIFETALIALMHRGSV